MPATISKWASSTSYTNVHQQTSPVNLQLCVEGQQPHSQSSSVTIQEVTVTQDGKQALAVIVAQPVVKNNREAQTKS